MDRVKLKMDAKAAMRQAAISPYGFTVIFIAIVVILEVVETFFNMNEVILDTIFGYRDLWQLLSFIKSSAAFYVIYFVVSTMIDFGYQSFSLKVSKRDDTMSYWDMFSSVRYIWKAVLLTIVMFVLELLWSLLLIIPGIIASYRYSQAVLILVENPEKGIFQCIHESSEMMKGHKWEYFVLELSFLLWYLMAIFTCGLGAIYVIPYSNVTFANFYNAIKPDTNMAPDRNLE